MWFDNFDKGLDSALQNLLLKKTSVLDIIPLHQKGVERSSCCPCFLVLVLFMFLVFLSRCFLVPEILKLSNLCRNSKHT